MRRQLSLVASLIAIFISYRNAMHPPGGVRPAEGENLQWAGQSILAAIYPDEYVIFLILNTVCFFSSVSVCLLLLSGFPLTSRFSSWLLSIAMCIILTTFGMTCMLAIDMTRLSSNQQIFLFFNSHVHHINHPTYMLAIDTIQPIITKYWRKPRPQRM